MAGTMRALVVMPKDKAVTVQDVPIPEPRPDQILVRVGAVALNRVDWLYTANPVAAQDRRVVGSDFAGEVVRVGEDLADHTDPRTKVGTRVAGFVQGACSINERPGAFAQCVVIEWDLTWHVPSSLSLEQAATINLCGLTAAQGVFTRLQFPCPFAQTEGFSRLDLSAGQPVNVLVNGATSSLGLFAAQLVRLAEKTSGTKIRLIGTASASHYALLRGAPYEFDDLVDYHDADWPGQVRKLTEPSKGLHYALDTVSVSPSVENVESLLSPEGRFAAYRTPALGNFDITKLKIKPLIGMVWEGLGHEIGYQGLTVPANPAAREFAARFYEYLGSEAGQGNVHLEPNPLRLIPGGLDQIAQDGLPLVSPNRPSGVRPVSAEKVVFALS